RTVDQVREEASLRECLEDLIDTGIVPAAELDPAVAHRRIRAAAWSRADTSWAKRPAAGAGIFFLIRETARLLLVRALALLVLPLLLAATVVLVLLVRVRELRDQPEDLTPTPEQVAALERREDFVAQNPFTAIGFVKPGLVRRIVMRGAL